MLTRSKLNSIESKIYEALINNENSHEDFMTIINEERNYRELKEIIRTMNSQRSDTEKINLIEEAKKIGIDETMILSKCAICGSKKSRFIKKQEASGILSHINI